jgi:hypothetical protein
MNDTALIWKNRVHDIGWYLQNGTLWRITGEYDKTTRTWKKQKRNLMTHHLQIFHTTIITKKRNVVGVKVHIQGNDAAMTLYFPTMHGKQCFIS